MRSDADVYTRLADIKQLWRELGRTPRSSPTYEVLMEQIRAESLAYQALIDVRQGWPAKPVRCPTR
jgi:TnpA family transposase